MEVQTGQLKAGKEIDGLSKESKNVDRKPRREDALFQNKKISVRARSEKKNTQRLNPSEGKSRGFHDAVQ